MPTGFFRWKRISRGHYQTLAQERTKLQHFTHKTAVFSVAAFMVVAVLGSAIFVTSLRDIIKTNKRNELSALLDKKSVELRIPVSDKISTVLKMARSPLIKQHFADPANAAIRAMAENELREYKNSLEGSTVFWVNDSDKMFYSGDNPPFPLDPSLDANYWYNMTMYETDTYNLNINFNPDLNNHNMWVNARVLNEKNEPVGILGAGIDISAFISSIYDGYSDRAELYLFNAFGEITGALDLGMVIAKTTLGERFGAPGPVFLETAKNLRGMENFIFETSLGIIGITPLPLYGWYILAISPHNLSDYNTPLSGLFLVMIAILGIIIAALNFFIAKLSVPLREAIRDLEQASKSKSEFLAKMSHEIRTPMNAIMGMAELASRKKAAPEEVREYVDTIKHAGANLLGIINDILDLSKIESGKLDINPVEYHVAALMTDVVNIIKMRLIGSSVRFDAAVDESVPAVLYGDETRVRQILLNLLSNAVKFTSAGSITCVLKGTQVDNSDDDILLTADVSDTGRGISVADLEILFGDFVRVDTKANRGIEGTGLGLAISKSLANAMGGDITVKSVYGEGSTFTMTLIQKVRSHEPTAPLDYGRGQDALVVKFTAPDARALVVDDIATNLQVAAGFLAPYGLGVDFCVSGKEAVAKALANHYDIVFMDHMMPEMDGVEATSRIRALASEKPYLADMPIIALTANAVTGAKEMFMQNGFSGFLSKPIDVNKLNALLEFWIPQALRLDAEIIVSGDDDDIEIDGVDTRLGIGRCGGRSDAYLSTLAVFCNDSRNKISELRRTAAANDPARFRIYVHALKGASANIGAEELSAHAKLLEEAAARGDAAFVATHADKLIAELETLVVNIGKTLAARKGGSGAAVDPGSLKPLLAHLKSALANIDAAAISSAAKQLEPFENADGTGVSVRLIMQHILNGDYDAAVGVIETLEK